MYVTALFNKIKCVKSILFNQTILVKSWANYISKVKFMLINYAYTLILLKKINKMWLLFLFQGYHRLLIAAAVPKIHWDNLGYCPNAMAMCYFSFSLVYRLFPTSIRCMIFILNIYKY